jgi:hypothetical protein
MKLIVLAVLLAIVQAAPPVPRKPSDTPAGSSQNITSHGVGELASVPVLHKDWWDRAYVIFTGLLVFVGIYGVVMARKTLKAIERQAKANEDQLTEIQQSAEKTDRMIILAAQEAENGKIATEAATKSADAAKDSAQAALLNARATINSERPWFLIKITATNSDCDIHGIPLHLGFTVSFQNCGKTPAEVVAFDQHPDCRKGTDDLPLPPRYSLEGNVMAHTRMAPQMGSGGTPEKAVFMLRVFSWKINGTRFAEASRDSFTGEGFNIET